MLIQPKILFILKKKDNYSYSTYSVSQSSGLFNSANFVSEMLDSKLKIETKIVEVNDNNDIDREVNLYRPTHVIIEALWVVPNKFQELHKLHPNVKWIVRIHSEIPFLATEGMAKEWLFGYMQQLKCGIDINIACNSKRAQQDLEEMFKCMEYKSVPVLYLPNYYPVNDSVNLHIKKDDRLDIGCFGAIRPMKNILKQAIAAITYANKYGVNINFHINAGRIEHGENTLKNLRVLFDNQKNHALIEHPWLTHDDFIELVKKMDLGMQVSLTETYNIVAADFVANNIPIVVSKEIDWIAPWCKVDPNSTNSIVDGMSRISFLGSTHICKILLRMSAKKAVKQWKTILTK